jgi:hypothetical protein
VQHWANYLSHQNIMIGSVGTYQLVNKKSPPHMTVQKSQNSVTRVNNTCGLFEETTIRMVNTTDFLRVVWIIFSNNVRVFSQCHLFPLHNLSYDLSHYHCLQEIQNAFSPIHLLLWLIKSQKWIWVFLKVWRVLSLLQCVTCCLGK